MGRAQKWIILPDTHHPYHDPRTILAVEKYERAHRFDGWIQLGDGIDLNELSSHVKGKPGAVTEDVSDTYAGYRDFLDQQAGILRGNNRKCRMVQFQGNHEYRAVSYCLERPELKKQLDVQRNLRLRDMGIEWFPSWENKDRLFKLGYAGFMHGHLTSKHHAMGMVHRYGVPVYYGHLHDVMLFPQVTHGNGKTLEGGSLGCLCLYKQRYLKGAPTNWQQAVSTIFVQPNGNFNLYVSRIFNHKFVGPDGVLYADR